MPTETLTPADAPAGPKADTKAGPVAKDKAKDRAAAGPTAPPEGLALIHVGYPDDPFRDQGLIMTARDANRIPMD